VVVVTASDGMKSARPIDKPFELIERPAARQLRADGWQIR
jgi:hypothetical protein